MSDETQRTLVLGPRADDATERLPVGALIGNFRIVASLAAGGGGQVYRAIHRVLDRRAAVKVLHRHLAVEPEMVERFVREAKAVNRIGHPGIVDIHELGTLDDGRPYYVMELVEGTDLATMLRDRGRMAPEEALAILTPVGDALHAAHLAGVVHRDLKASNVLIGERNGQPLIKLHDFGIAKLVDLAPGEAPLTAFGRRLGTPYAMAPEQIRGDAIDHRVDVYAMGVLVFQMLTGTYPFVADEPAELESLHLSQPPPAPSSRAPVSAALDAVVVRCLAKRPEDRFPDVPTLLSALRAAARDDGGAAAGTGVAIYVEAPVEDDSVEAADRQGEVLDRLEAYLAAAGYALALQLAGALLAVRPITPRVPAPEVAAAAADLEAIQRMIGAEVDRWRVVAHVDAYQTRAGRPHTGPLLRVSSWVTSVSPGETLTPAGRAWLTP